MACPMGINIARGVNVMREALSEAGLVPLELMAVAQEQAGRGTVFGVGLRHKAWEIKREQIDATGAGTVVLSCASCRLNFMAAADIDQWPTRIASLVELVAERLPK